MFKKFGPDNGDTVKEAPDAGHISPSVKASTEQINTILKGSKLTGDINVSCDLALSGDVEGNITSLQDSSIIIQGTCKGNITTKGGSVKIEGALSGGNITAGKDVHISGKFAGGEVMAAGKVFVNGEFEGRLQGREIEIGSEAKGKGEIFYEEYISISRGAQVEAQISQTKKEVKVVNNSSEKNVVDIKAPKEASKDK